MTTSIKVNKGKAFLALAVALLFLIIGIIILKNYVDNKLPSIETSPPEGTYMTGIYGHSLDLTRDGGFIVSGYVKYQSREYRDHDLWVMKANKKGEMEWSKTFGGPSTDRAWAVKQMSDGEYLIAGETYSFGQDYQLLILKLDRSGDQSWYKLLGGDHIERGKGMHLTADGNALISGEAYSDSLKRPNFLLAKVTADGEVLFEKSFDHDLSGAANSVSELPNKDIVLLGNLQSEEDHSIDFGLLRLNEGGKIVSKKRFGSINSDEANAILALPDGAYLIAGTEYKDPTNKADVVVYKFNAADELEWKNYYGGLSADGGEKIIVTADGGYALVGYTQSFGAGFKDVYVIKLASTGQTEWTQTVGGNKTDWGYDLKQTPDHGFLISAGSKSTGQNATDIWIIKLDKNGLKEWDKVYCTP